jgi:transposase-like protein
MTNTRRTYSRDFKLEALGLVETSGECIRRWTTLARRPANNSTINNMSFA